MALKWRTGRKPRKKMTAEEKAAAAHQRALDSIDRDIAYARRLEAELMEEIAAVQASIARFEAERAELQNEEVTDAALKTADQQP